MLAATGAALLAGCGNLFPARYRFRMTVEVDTPQGLRTGSSVMEVTSYLQTNPGGVAPVHTELKGEAVAVDLPGGRTLFALVEEDLSGSVTLAFEPGYRGRPEQFVASVKKLGRSDQLGRAAVLPTDKYPQLVTFRDISDPRSLEIVNMNSLGTSIGTGIALRRIALEITNENVTTGIERRLNWLNHLDSYRNDASNPFTSSLPRQIGELRSSKR